MAPGSTCLLTGGAGSQPWLWWTWAGGLTVIAGAGFGPIVAGIGNPIMPGAGLLSIMAGGIVVQLMAGFGFPIRLGPRLGSPGGIRTPTAAGPHCHQVPTSMSGLVSGSMAAASDSALISDLCRTVSLLFPLAGCATARLGIIACHQLKSWVFSTARPSLITTSPAPITAR